ncbi:MAG: DNA-directed RNA polymerase subunit beta' [Chloroflexi bacterium]|nr:DNA-directed RNA polymerase subunit beta' [Chloroflexota bacterium]
MLEVNDFNAIRLSLASPAQIRSWSYGEVTKPETINYRTLKPEKDGLFCEKIFGPTKDFECYCGKYKRVRYKGIVCDKCGVEVARSKVRRERMGHISLAAPVAHIWFAKGVPSRLGLLLDVAPRALERVLYFAQYAITSVNPEAQQHALELLQQEIDEEVSRREGESSGRIAVREEALEQEIAEIGRRQDVELAAADEELNESIDETMREASALEQDLQERSGEKLRAKQTFRGETLATRGEVIGTDVITTLREITRQQVGAIEERIATKKADIQLAADAAAQQKRDAAFEEMEPLRQQIAQVRTEVRKEYDPLAKRLEKLRDPVEADQLTILTEAEHAELEERFGLVFEAGMGAEAILSILERLDLEHLRGKLREEIQSSSGQRRKKATKRLRIVEQLHKSGNRPEWMIVQELPVLPPDLRPMVQLDGGRFATSDLNDLYRRVINRNNRLKRLVDLGAPEIIIRNEKRMLQEAVDSLIDNGRRGRAVSGSGNHKLKSLSDMLKGKQGRFRQNLLGKRVDYSGRSVIIVGPDLKLHQCGLPKRMALELFKPFVMHALVANGSAHNIKSAKRIVERARPEVWDVLDDVIAARPVLLNRAPTLHRLGIQAFEPVLIEGSAIKLHPLVCSAFNADFDGDQMAVHVPLSREAVAEARQIMLSTHNLLSPGSGEPVIAPTLDMVLGCYYLTLQKPGLKGEFKEASNGTPAQGVYGSFDDALRAHNVGLVELHATIKVRDARTENQFIQTTTGRIIFNEVLPPEMGFYNEVMDKKTLKTVVAQCQKKLGNEHTAEVVNEIKDLGFHYATRSGITIAINDLHVPDEKPALLEAADKRVSEIEDQYEMGLITDQERYDASISIWTETTDKVQQAIEDHLDRYGSVYMMAASGAKGNIAQIRQMAGMRGLMTDPSGRIIDLPIRSSFREGLSVLEYFISTHGARKGLADTALRTADSGYLTRRLIDVAQDVIIESDDCGTTNGIWLTRPADEGILQPFSNRVLGRWAASDIIDPKTNEVIVLRGEEIDERIAERIDGLKVDRVYVYSTLTCNIKRGVCRLCYGRSLATGNLIKMSEAVGIIAAQSIGEPGTQLTMRTFHTGGVAGLDITSGLPRIEEIFEARVPKSQSIMSEIDGTARIVRDGDMRKITVTSTEFYSDSYEFPKNIELLVKHNEEVEQGAVLARAKQPRSSKKKEEEEETAVAEAEEFVARIGGRVVFEGKRKKPSQISIVYEATEEREYTVPANARLRLQDGDQVTAGQQLTEGQLNPQDILHIIGPEAVHLYLVEEVQKVYHSQGVTINDKHIEVIVRQMLRKVQVDSPGDTEMLPSELVDRYQYEDENARILAEGGEPATAVPVLLGVTKASLSTSSFLAAASFQETTRVLTEAAISGKVDHLLGLKENVIIGKLIPARAKIDLPPRVEEIALPDELALPEGEAGAKEEMSEQAVAELMGTETKKDDEPRVPTSYIAEPDSN